MGGDRETDLRRYIRNIDLGNYGTEFIGPFHEMHKVAHDGYRVPHLAAQPLVDESGNQLVALVLDERFMIEGTVGEVAKWIPFLANAMAVAAGYSCHGDNCRPLNPYTVKMTGLSAKNYGDDPKDS